VSRVVKELATPLSGGDRPGINRTASLLHSPGDRYGVGEYRCAITRALEYAGVPAWSPKQLRQAAANEVRARFGLEASQVVLGHSTARTSEIYVEKILAAGFVMAQAIG
jgi:hypothetical protein